MHTLLGPFSFSLMSQRRNVAIKYGRLFRGRSGARSRLAAGEMEPHCIHARHAPTTTTCSAMYRLSKAASPYSVIRRRNHGWLVGWLTVCQHFHIFTPNSVVPMAAHEDTSMPSAQSA